MSFIVTLFLIALVTLILCVPSIKANLADISPSFLDSQSSVGPTRKPGESATYRSVDVPHGLPLTGGLRIQIGYKLRDGSLKDIWSIALKGAPNMEISFGKVVLTVGQINTILHTLAKKFEGESKIGVFSDLTSPDSLLVVLSCLFVAEKTVVNLNSVPKDKIEGLGLVVADTKYLGAAASLGVKTVDSKELVSLTDIKSSDEYSYHPAEDYMKFNNQPYTEVNTSREVHFFQRSFVSAVGARLMSLPPEFAWSEQDKVLIGVTPRDGLSKNFLLTNLLCGLVSKVARISIVEESKLDSLQGYTILAASDRSIQRLVSSTKVSPVRRFLIGRAESLNSQGIFTRLGAPFSPKLHLKLIYALQTSNPLTSRQYNALRSTLGSRVIRESYNELAVGPVLKTNVFDHRVLATEKSRGFRVTQLGVCTNSLEIKVKKNKEEDSTGDLWGRGYSVGKGIEGVDYDEDFWVALGVHGRFAKDGCFYEYMK